MRHKARALWTSGRAGGKCLQSQCGGLQLLLAARAAGVHTWPSQSGRPRIGAACSTSAGHACARPAQARHSSRGPPKLDAIERHFHALIRERADGRVLEHALRLLKLEPEPLLEMETPKVWFAVLDSCDVPVSA